MNLKIYALLAMFFSLILSANAQSGQFSQYIYHGAYINPAYSGFKGELNAHSYYRNEWTGGPEGNPETFSFMADASLKDDKMGLSFMITDDRAGVEGQLSSFVNYSYKLKVSDKADLAFGLGAGFTQYSFDESRIETGEDDPTLSYTKQSTITPELRAGVYFSTPLYFVGFAAENLIGHTMKNINDPENPMTANNVQLNVNAGISYLITDNFRIKHTALYRHEFDVESFLDFNTAFGIYDRIWIGGSYRANFSGPIENSFYNSMVVFTELHVTSKIRVGYSFDAALGSTKGFNTGSHEFSLGYTFGNKKPIDEQNKLSDKRRYF